MRGWHSFKCVQSKVRSSHVEMHKTEVLLRRFDLTLPEHTHKRLQLFTHKTTKYRFAFVLMWCRVCNQPVVFPTHCWTSSVRGASLFSPQSQKPLKETDKVIKWSCGLQGRAHGSASRLKTGADAGQIVHPFHSVLLHLYFYGNTDTQPKPYIYIFYFFPCLHSSYFTSTSHTTLAGTGQWSARWIQVRQTFKAFMYLRYKKKYKA